MLRSRSGSMLQAAADLVSPQTVKILLKIEGMTFELVVKL